MSDGYSDVTEAEAQAPKGRYHGYCFYHEQDVERALDGDGLTLAFGSLDEDDEQSVSVGRHIVSLLSLAGFDVTWNESAGTRIQIPAFDWKRRHMSATWP